MRRFGVVLLVLLVSTAIATAATFPDTDSVSSASPSDISDDVRVEVPYASNASVSEVTSTAGNYTIEIETDSDSVKQYYVAKDVITPYEFTEDVVLFVDGSQTSFDESQHIERNWTSFEASGSDITVTYVPASTAGGGGILEWLHFFFLENSVTILLSALVGGALLFGAIAYYMSGPDNIEWQ